MTLQWLPAFRPHTSAIEAGKTQATENENANGAGESTADKTSPSSSSSANSPPPRSLMSLPPELHLQIAQHLIYPDALSLKHTSRYFYSFVDTGIELKVDWLLARRRLHLDCPNETSCCFGSDLRFCRGSVPLLMKRRREHIECESRPGLGCLIYGTRTCVHRRPPGNRLRRWFRRRLTVEAWWVLLALVPLALSWLWFAELFVFATSAAAAA